MQTDKPSWTQSTTVHYADDTLKVKILFPPQRFSSKKETNLYGRLPLRNPSPPPLPPGRHFVKQKLFLPPPLQIEKCPDPLDIKIKKL